MHRPRTTRGWRDDLVRARRGVLGPEWARRARAFPTHPGPLNLTTWAMLRTPEGRRPFLPDWVTPVAVALAVLAMWAGLWLLAAAVTS